MRDESTRDYFDRLNREYLAVHRRKEDLFWATYMGTSDEHELFAEAEKAYKAFVSEAATLRELRDRISRREADIGPGSQELLAGLRGWEALFSANAIEGAEGREAMSRIVSLEAELFAMRQAQRLRHIGESGREEEATLGSLLMNQTSNPSEPARASSLRALRDLEEWVLANGFIEIVKARNEFARSQGFRDFFEYKVRKSESMSVEGLFAILDEFERATAAANARSLKSLERAFGASALEPWNIRYRMSGELVRELDPYFPFELALERWTKSFRRLGIGFRGATLQLDLLERRGKHQNGFCHGPVPAFYDRGTWVPAHVNFTSEGRPLQPGAGQRALETLFHEGGHAAHFANVAMNSPCFSQEYPPTSMAYAETQSMLCDSLLGDADWLARYAKTAEGSPIPPELVRRRIESEQPFRAYNERLILVVPYFERALYALGDSELGSGRILELARETERRILGGESSRPLLAIPHLLNQESAASYHGYLLAHMAVYQTRAWLADELGYIVDNPAVGPLLAKEYWAPGNSRTHDQGLRALTGELFNPRYLAQACNATADEAWAAASDAMSAAAARDYPEDYPASLDAEIHIVHGDLCYADNKAGEEKMCADFAEYVRRNYPRAQS